MERPAVQVVLEATVAKLLALVPPIDGFAPNTRLAPPVLVTVTVIAALAWFTVVAGNVSVPGVTEAVGVAAA